MRRWVSARRGRKGDNAPPRRLNGGVGRGRSRCCRAVLALAGFSGLFAHIVPTQPQVLIPLNPCKLLSLLEPASGLEPLTCGLRSSSSPLVPLAPEATDHPFASVLQVGTTARTSERVGAGVDRIGQYAMNGGVGLPSRNRKTTC